MVKLVAMLVLCGVYVVARAEEAVRLRGGAGLVKGTVEAVDVDGVVVSEGGKARALSWDVVAEVRGERAGEARAFAAVAERAWRARTRLERLDYVAAEPLFEELGKEYAGRRGATAAMVAEGLLRCRLRRGVQTGSVEPWLAWMLAEEGAGEGAGGVMRTKMQVVIPPGSPPLVDEATGLCPSVPPVWMRVASVEAFAHDGAGALDVGGEVKDGAKDGAKGGVKGAAGEGAKDAVKEESATELKVRALRRMYVLAAAFECGKVGEVGAGELKVRHPDPGVALVAQIVAARVGTAEVRREARRLLIERLGQRQAQWMEAWVRIGIGRSLLRESSVEERLLGVGQVLQVSARLRGASPYLAGVALASAIVHASAGNAAGAWALKKEMMEVLPGHPGLDLEAVRNVRAPRAGKSGTGPGEERAAQPGEGAAEEAK